MARKKDDSASILHGDGVEIISYCPFCRNSYKAKDVEIILEKKKHEGYFRVSRVAGGMMMERGSNVLEEHTLMRVTCGACSCSIVARVMISPWGIMSMAIVTDLQEDEVKRYADRKLFGIETDDVLEAHTHMKYFPKGFMDQVLKDAGGIPKLPVMDVKKKVKAK